MKNKIKLYEEINNNFIKNFENEMDYILYDLYNSWDKDDLIYLILNNFNINSKIEFIKAFLDIE